MLDENSRIMQQFEIKSYDENAPGPGPEGVFYFYPYSFS